MSASLVQKRIYIMRYYSFCFSLHQYGKALNDFGDISRALNEAEAQNATEQSLKLGKQVRFCIFLIKCRTVYYVVAADANLRKSNKTSRKTKEKQMQQELQNFYRILEFSPYQADPFGSIQNHLENSIKKQSRPQKPFIK